MIATRDEFDRRDDGVIVLKFGSSVLTDLQAYHIATDEIYRYVRRGIKVIAVVSAMGDTTDTLLREAEAIDEFAPDDAVTTLLATGELASAARLRLVLNHHGVPSVVLDHHQLQLHTTGPHRHARVRSVRVDRIESALAGHDVLIVPGFLGVDRDGGTTLLGRGGSDLTAVFLAHQLQARCVLVKDVDGLYEFDPAVGEDEQRPRRFERITFDDALTLNAPVLAEQAVRYGREHDFAFEIAAIGSSAGTVVGSAATHAVQEHAPAPLRIAILGCGTVGRAVYDRLRSQPERFEVVGIAVRDADRHARAGVPRSLLTDDPFALIARPCDVVIEVIGGEEPAVELIEAALVRGRHVITANKLVLAKFGGSLKRIAEHAGVCLNGSAAVGGGVPMLERVHAIAAQQEIKTIRAILNGTCNFVLDQIAVGSSFHEAIAEAQQRGLAEADPTHDLNGFDAACKLALLAEVAFGCAIDPRRIPADAINETLVARNSDGRLRQVTSLRRHDDSIEPGIELRDLEVADALAGICREYNAIEITTADNERFIFTGKGAGGSPTALSIIGDLNGIARRITNSVSTTKLQA